MRDLLDALADFEPGNLMLAGVSVATVISLVWALAMWTRVAVFEARQHRWFEAEEAAFGELIHALVDTDAAGGLRSILERLPPRSQDRTVSRLGLMIRGTELEQLARAAVLAGVVGRATDRLTSPRWSQRLRGVVLLSALGFPYHLAPRLLRDRSPVVRLAAVRWIERDGTVLSRFDHMVAALEDPDGMVQAAAKDALVSGGLPLVPRLVETLQNATCSPTRRMALLDVAVELHEPKLVDICRRHTLAADAGLRSKAIAVFGDTSVPAAELVPLFDDRDASVRQAAVSAAGSRREPDLIGHVGRCLDDHDWRVRDLAAATLGRFGDLGMVVLRGRSIRATSAS